MYTRAFRLSRQSDIIPNGYQPMVMVIGAGSIGSNAANLLAGIGVEEMTIVDYDDVNYENIAPSFFSIDDIGKNKAAVLKERLERWYGDAISITAVEGRGEDIEDAGATYDIIIVGTDSLSSRRELWQIRDTLSGHNDNLWWIDGRMGGPLCDVYAVSRNDIDRVVEYEQTLLNAPSSLPCGMKATSPLTKGIIPGFIGQIYSDLATGKEPPFLQRYDLRNGIHLSMMAPKLQNAQNTV